MFSELILLTKGKKEKVEKSDNLARPLWLEKIPLHIPNIVHTIPPQLARHSSLKLLHASYEGSLDAG